MGPNNHNNYWIKEMNNYPAVEDGGEGGKGWMEILYHFF
jgi:hypothetical protein